MADEAAQEQEQVAPAQPGPKSKILTLLLVLGVMGGEGAGVYFLTKFLSPAPPVALAEDDRETAGGDSLLDRPVKAEVQLADMRVTNANGMKSFNVKIRVSALILTENKEDFEKLVEQRQARIEDRISAVLRKASKKTMSEPGYQTIKRQIKHELGVVLEDDALILEILVPQLLQN